MLQLRDARFFWVSPNFTNWSIYNNVTNKGHFLLALIVSFFCKWEQRLHFSSTHCGKIPYFAFNFWGHVKNFCHSLWFFPKCIFPIACKCSHDFHLKKSKWRWDGVSAKEKIPRKVAVKPQTKWTISAFIICYPNTNQNYAFFYCILKSRFSFYFTIFLTEKK